MKANTTYELTASDFCKDRMYSGSRACTLGWMQKLSIEDVVSEDKFEKVWHKEANKAGVGYNMEYDIARRNDDHDTTKEQLATVFNNTMAALNLEIVDA